MTKVNAPSQRHGLLYLAFPSFFLPIAKTEHRAQIRGAFLPKIGASSGDQDDDLHRIYAALCAEHGRSVSPLSGAVSRGVGPGQLRPPRRTKAPATSGNSSCIGQRALRPRWTWLPMSVRTRWRWQSVSTLCVRWCSQTIQSGRNDFKSALNFGNLLDSFFKTALFNELREHAAEVRDAVLKLWESEPAPALFDQFQADLKAISQQRSYTGGNSTALGSVLLMARDLRQFPPYRPTPAVKAGQLTGTTAVGDKPSERYDALLQLCDEVLERSADSGLELADRLDAQGLIWSVVTYDPPASWGPAEAAAFKAWRGDAAADPPEPAPTRAWLVRGDSVNGHDLVPTWLERGSGSLAASNLREVSAGMTPRRAQAHRRRGLLPCLVRREGREARRVPCLPHRMQPGDLVATTEPGSALRRARSRGGHVPASATTDAPTSRRMSTGLSDEMASTTPTASESPRGCKVQRDVVDLTQQLDALEALVRHVQTAEAPQSSKTVDSRCRRHRRAGEIVYVDQAWLQECIDLLDDRPQLIFYGPPGTGKTYIAQELAEHRRRRQRPAGAVPPGVHLRGLLRGLPAGRSDDGRLRAQAGPAPQDRRPGARRTRRRRTSSSSTRSTAATWPRSSASSTSCWSTATSNVDLLYAGDDDGSRCPRTCSSSAR